MDVWLYSGVGIVLNWFESDSNLKTSSDHSGNEELSGDESDPQMDL